MKLRILSVLLVAAGLLSLSSCEKSASKAIPGTYHFKMSGNIECECVTPGYTDIKQKFIISNEAGQMYIIDNEDGGWLVNMSVMMSSHSLMFYATYDKDTDALRLERGTGILLLAEEGTTGSIMNRAPAVQVELSGKGTYYENGNYIILNIYPISNFVMETTVGLEDVLLEYKVISDEIICFAKLEK